MRLAYEGARTGRRTSGWMSSGASANAEIGVDLARLRERSRELIRNNHFGAKAAREFSTKVVGAGIELQIADDRAMTLWTQWSEECSADGLPHFGAIQALVARTLFESGECLVRFRMRTAADRLAVPFQLQILEPDFLDMSKTGTTATGYMIHGVEFDLVGRRVAYWLYPQHPGEVTTTVRRSSLQSNRIPADQILHIYDTLRPGQVRGVPSLAPVMLAMRDLDDWENAELVRKKTEACLAGFITSPEENVALGPQSTSTTSAQLLETFEPGMVTRLRPGESITVNNPQHAGGYSDYKRSRCRDFAAGIGMPYEILTGDLSQINYSSYRGGLLGFRDAVEAVQYNVMIPRLCRPTFRKFIAIATDFAGLPARNYEDEWTPPAFDLLDREAEAKADEIELRLGTKTWPQTVARQGYDPEKQLATIAEWRPRLTEAGVSFAPNGVSNNANNQNSPTQN